MIPFFPGFAPTLRLTSLLVCLVPWLFAQAQTSASPAAASHSAACKINTAEPTEADLAFARGDMKKAASLFAAAYAKDPNDLRSRELEIDSLLRQGKIDEARKKTEAWTAVDSTSAYAILTASQLRFAEGDWPESYGLALKAVKADPCLATIYESLAGFEEVAGFRATAAKHLALAHQLAPHDESIWNHWIGSLPSSQLLEEGRKYLETSKAIDEKARPAITSHFSKLAALSEDRCELTSVSSGPVRIPMQPIDEYGVRSWGLEIAFNGHKRTLQIDTGASGFTITHGSGGTLGLHAIDTSRVGGFGNNGSAGVVLNRADSIRVGGLEFKNCVVETLTSSGVMGGSLMGMGTRLDPTDGLVGADIFDRYLVTLDYIKHEIRLESLPKNPAVPIDASQFDPLGGRIDPDWMRADRYVDPSMQSWTKIYRRGHMLIMPARLHTESNSGRPVLFIVDTGAEGNLVDLNAIKEFSSTKETMNYIQGLSGVQGISETGKFTVDFAGLRLPVKNMDSTNLVRFGGITGFFGLPTLQQLVMHIDYRDNLANFEAPTAKH